jgi:hypothetical protein
MNRTLAPADSAHYDPAAGQAVHAAGIARLRRPSLHPDPVTNGGHDDVP